MTFFEKENNSTLWLNFLGVTESQDLHKLHHKLLQGPGMPELGPCIWNMFLLYLCKYGLCSLHHIVCVYVSYLCKDELVLGTSDYKIPSPRFNPMFTGSRFYSLYKEAHKKAAAGLRAHYRYSFLVIRLSLFFSLLEGGGILTLSIHFHKVLVSHLITLQPHHPSWRVERACG